MNKGLIGGELKRAELAEMKIIPWHKGDNYNDNENLRSGQMVVVT